MKNEVLAYFTAALLAATSARFVANRMDPKPGSLHGMVTDPSGAAIPGAEVTVTGPKLDETLVTDGAGGYEAPSLSPGHYSVLVRAAGFDNFQRTELVVSNGFETEADAPLAITEPSQALTVRVGVSKLQRTAR